MRWLSLVMLWAASARREEEWQRRLPTSISAEIRIQAIAKKVADKKAAAAAAEAETEAAATEEAPAAEATEAPAEA